MSPQEQKQTLPWIDPNDILVLNTEEIVQSEFPMQLVVDLISRGIFIDRDFYIIRRKKDFFDALIAASNKQQ